MILVDPARIADYTARGWWGRTTLLDCFDAAVSSRPLHEAVVDPPNRAMLDGAAPERLTYRALAERVAGYAGALHAQGVGADQIVCVQLPNCSDQVAIYLAILRLGAIITPVPLAFREHELEHVLRHTGASTVITTAHVGTHDFAAMHVALAARLNSTESSPGLNCIRVLGVGDHLPNGVTQLIAGAHQAPPTIALDANAVATICWTSGTESSPKGVPRSHNEWLIVAPSIIEGGAVAPGARILNPFPLVNMAGFSTGFATWLSLGATLVQHHPFDFEVFLQQLRDERIDYTVAAPAILNRLLKEPALLDGIDLNRLRRIGSGSAPLAEWMIKGFAARGVEIVNYFGSNEGAALTGSPQDVPDPADRARYFPRAGVDGFDWSVSTTRKIRTKLVDPTTDEEISKRDQIGELRFEGPTIFSGYYRAPELDATAFDRDGYYRTGDLFRIAGERMQWYEFAGRAKDIVNRGGMKISSEEIENLLAGHPAIQEAAIIGIADEALGERVCAVIAMRNGARVELSELVAYLRDQARVAAYKLPERLEIVSALPRNAVGKVLKRELRQQFGNV